MATFIIAGVIVLLVALAGVYTWRQSKRGGCASCSQRDCCAKKR
ncbi:MAG: FeoB-associated Cys-rich membrane protein [Oscillospiraceae bacterium]|nr:FeoB-associated Cys-rich membrane protein [Oscillospiraceae bacterium]